MNLKLYIVSRIGGAEYDEYDSFAVVADSAKAARKLASKADPDPEEKGDWLDPRITNCRQVKFDKPGVVCESFRSG